MDWKKLISIKNQSGEEPALSEAELKLKPYYEKYPIGHFERDYSEIVTSAPFRRLQDKTQVFPLDKSDFVRTRLTHSMEVSAIAKQLGTMIINKTEFPLPIEESIRETLSEPIASILSCAGLLHDLGNPPFGHFGETVIGDWFKTNLSKIEYNDDKKLEDILKSHKNGEQMIKELESFNGNAQTLRLLSKPDINISASIVSTLIKYPENLSYERKKDGSRSEKLGFFSSENEMLAKVSSVVGIQDKTCRHPLTFILEAADDIAYITADLEDALKKKLVSLRDLISFFYKYIDKLDNGHKKDCTRELYDNLNKEYISCYSIKKDDIEIFKNWTVNVQKWLMYVAAWRFAENYDGKGRYANSFGSIIDGTYSYDLFRDTNHQYTVEMMKEALQEFVFNDHGILKLELSAQTIISSLLNGFINAARHPLMPWEEEKSKNKYEGSKADRKYLELLSKNYKNDYDKAKIDSDEAQNLYLRLLMITDFISGMTDSYAQTLYRELSGIE
ncbi:MAG: dNTP triphosphohydrolase [Defluviitaleaceae bacterium]|nr:dNTP triphosphohydrolase [Defluviitaleaceae bacterium]